ncbi:PEP-CTERM sorting domain-containing protein [Deferrisoma palaeochoriense]
MRQWKATLVGAAGAAILAIGGAGTALAVPALPAGDIILEFSSWEELIKAQGNTLPLSPQPGDQVRGVFYLDSFLKAGTNEEVWSPSSFPGQEITGVFEGLIVGSTSPDPFSNNVFETVFTFSSATVKIYFDDDLSDDGGLLANLNTGNRANAFAAASDGTPLLKLDWGDLRATTNQGGTLAGTGVTVDDTTTNQGMLTLQDDPMWLWNNTNLWDMERYEFPFASGNFYPFQFTSDIYVPGQPDFDSNVASGNPSGWSFYDSDDMRASVVPEPGTMVLLGSGLLGMAGAARRRKKNCG